MSEPHTRRSRGSIIQRGRDSRKWSIVLDLGRNQTGRRKRQWISVSGSRRDAERKLNELLHQIDSGHYSQPSKVTFGSFLERWLLDYA